MIRWILAIIALWAAYQVRMQIPPFLAGAILAYLLSGPIGWLSARARINRGLSIAAVYLTVVGGLGYLLYRISPMVAEQSMGLISHRRVIIENVVKHINATTGWQLDVAQVTGEVLEKLQSFITDKPLELLEIGGFVGHSIFFLMIMLVSSIYLVADPRQIGRFILRFFPDDLPEGAQAQHVVGGFSGQMTRKEAIQMASEINEKFRKYLVGQVALVLIMTVMAYCILSFNNVHYALVIAIVTGFLEIIPMLGPIMALALSAVIATSQFGVGAALGVVALLWAARLFEDYVIIPRVIGHAVQVHGLVTIFAVVAGETLGGGLGMLMALPVAGALKVLIDHTHEPLPAPPQPAQLTMQQHLTAFARKLKEWWQADKK